MAQGANTLFRTVMAGLLVLAALVLFGALSTAHVHTRGAGHHASHAAAAMAAASMTTVQHAAAVVRLETAGTGTAVMRSATAIPTEAGDCGDHDGSTADRGCCAGGACPMMHSGLTPAGLLPVPPLESKAVPLPSGLLSKGIATLPIPRPPRTSV